MQSVERCIKQLDEKDQIAEKGEYRHFMQKEIFEQATVLADTTAGRIAQRSYTRSYFWLSGRRAFRTDQ